MARRPRIIAETGIYHIMMRGVNKQAIFVDDMDMNKMLRTLQKVCDEMDADIYAWCFMQNHIHLLVKSEKIDLMIKKLGCSYVAYFNKKYKRVGHLFQDRFKSIPVLDDVYLMVLMRYIHQNPVKANICPISEYRWSSYNDFLNQCGIVNLKIYQDLFESSEEYIEFMNDYSSKYELEEKEHLDDEEAKERIKQYVKTREIKAITNMSKNNQIEAIKYFLMIGIQPLQIVEYCGFTRYLVYKVKNSP